MTKLQNSSELEVLRKMLRTFADERDWQQFHTPKNLATALSVEAAELLEPFQWLVNGGAEELDSDKLAAIRFEMADVLAYLIMLADKLDVNLFEALQEKIVLNAAKYPVTKARGNASKYTRFEN